MTEVKKIEQLSPEQEAQLPVYRDKWLSIGKATGPVNLEEAKAATIKAYALAGLPPPENFYSVRSPIEAIQLIKKLDPSKSASDIISDMSFGNHDASWLGFYEFFRNVCDIEECKKLDGLSELAHNCGWVSFYDTTVVFQDRPEYIKMDDENRCHCEDGPAIRYSDGFSIYMWHGVQIPDEWIENKASVTTKIALTWENVEQRRVACEIIGWNNILRELNAKIIDEDPDPMVGTLVEADIPEIGPERFLRVLCGTGREFALPVPPEMETALEANAWTYGLDAKDFWKPEVRT